MVIKAQESHWVFYQGQKLAQKVGQQSRYNYFTS